MGSGAGGMNSQIEIHTEEHMLTPDHDGVAFNIYLDGEKLQCVITGAALKSRFKESAKPIMDIFIDNQETIASMTGFLLATHPERIDGAVIIRPEDLQQQLA